MHENVLLYVNQQQGRAGVTGAFQHPGLLGGGSNNVQLVAGHRIWLVSPAYAKALESVVPQGSLTGGAVAKVKRFAAHLEDILQSVTESRHHLDEVAGEHAQAIREHLPEIAGIVAGFLMAEATSAFLAATPTGVGQIAAVVIQLALAAFGAAGMVQAGVAALGHASQWLTVAWTAKGEHDKIVAASIELLKMLVAIAIAALSHAGVKGNHASALKIARSMPTGGLPALATVGGAHLGNAGAGTAALVGPSTGSLGVAGARMIKHESGEGGSQAAEAGRGEKPSSQPSEANGRPIVPAGRTLSAEETVIADQLVAEGHTVEALAESSERTADCLVDGVPTELKTISNITSPDPSGALARRICEGAGQASNIIADVRARAGMTRDLAQRAVRRAFGADRGKRVRSVRLIGQDFDVTIHRVVESDT